MNPFRLIKVYSKERIIFFILSFLICFYFPIDILIKLYKDIVILIIII